MKPMLPVSYVARIAVLLAAVTFTSCADAPPPAAAPADAFAALERRLLEADAVTVVFHITSEGALASDVRGRLALHGAQAELVADGELGQRPLHVRMTTAANELRGGADGAQVLGPVPPALREGLLLGLTRMGLLHNIAMLGMGRAPDRADGTIRAWAQASGFRDAGGGAIGFDIEVGGQRAGEATLSLLDGLPAVRHQKVQFPEGEMRVVERYSELTAQ